MGRRAVSRRPLSAADRAGEDGAAARAATYDSVVAHDVDFEDVRRMIGRFGPTATMVTVADDLRPHVVTAMIGVDGGHLVADVGPRTRSNLVYRPSLTLVWSPHGDDEYQLVLDGTAEHVGEPDDRDVCTLRIAVVGGILRRLAGLPAGPPTCRSLAAAADA